MKKVMHLLFLVFACGLGACALTGCDVDEGPVEEAGEAVDETIDEAEEGIDEAGELDE